MTSNVQVPEGADAREALRSHFRPEFLNRADEIITFQRLTQAHLAAIVDIQLARLRERLTAQHIELELTKEARELLAAKGWDQVYGARPLKRAVQRYLQDPLAKALLDGTLHQGRRIRASVDDSKAHLTFRESPLRAA